MDTIDEFRIFTETSESLGILYDSYKSIPGYIAKFMDKLDPYVKQMIHDPRKSEINLADDIKTFKSDINKKFTPFPISIKNIKSTRKNIQTTRRQMDVLLDRFSKAKKGMSFRFGGTNPLAYVKSMIVKPKIYSKKVDEESYAVTNNNIRNINRALDWVERIMIDMYNMIDQDLNILTIVDKVYAKNLIYEGVALEQDNSSGESEGSAEKISMPKQTDAAESDKNGVRRKKLYIAFIEWCKAYNNKNVFGSIFDKDAFKLTYPFVPNEMRYFYRLANPILCVLGGDLTFFQASELRKVNAENPDMNKMLIFAATQNDLRIFNVDDKKIYLGVIEDGKIVLKNVLGNTFDTYIQNMINQGDILNGPVNESVFDGYDELMISPI